MELPDGSRLIRLVKGEEASKAIANLHWSPRDIPVRDALIAEYSSGARLWVSKVDNNACKIVEAMAIKMTLYADELPYTKPIKHEIGGITVYLSIDKRNKWLNAFWCTRNLVIWVELPPHEVNYLSLLIKSIR